MIHFVTTKDHAYTVESLIERHGRKVIRQWNYEQLFLAKSLPLGTWVFTDHERMSAIELSNAGHFASLLKNQGARIINHPAQVRSRFEILRRLNSGGINGFSAYRCESNPQPGKFPVFIRNEFDHSSESLILFQSQTELDTELNKLESNGIPLVGKLVIEYSGQQVLPGVWCRFSTYCAAGKIIAHHMGFDKSWIVKDGFDKNALQNHPDKDRLIEMESRFVTQNQHSEVLEKAFRIAGIEYGRADFSILDKQVQIYEINTNPTHASESEIYGNIHPGREPLLKQSEHKLQNTILSLNQPDGERIQLYGSLLERIKRRFTKAIN